MISISSHYSQPTSHNSPINQPQSPSANAQCLINRPSPQSLPPAGGDSAETIRHFLSPLKTHHSLLTTHHSKLTTHHNTRLRRVSRFENSAALKMNLLNQPDFRTMLCSEAAESLRQETLRRRSGISFHYSLLTTQNSKLTITPVSAESLASRTLRL